MKWKESSEHRLNFNLTCLVITDDFRTFYILLFMYLEVLWNRSCLYLSFILYFYQIHPERQLWNPLSFGLFTTIMDYFTWMNIIMWMSIFTWMDTIIKGALFQSYFKWVQQKTFSFPLRLKTRTAGILYRCHSITMNKTNVM